MRVIKKTISRTMIVSAVSLAISIFLPFYVFAAQDLEKAVIQSVNQKWTGDFEQMVDNRVIRVLIPYSKTFYFLDGATQKGATYELVREFEKMINKQLKTRHLKVQVLFIPTSRNRLIPAWQKASGILPQAI